MYLQQLFSVEFDVIESEFGIEFSKIIVLEMFGDDAGGFKVGALDDIYKFDDVGVI